MMNNSKQLLGHYFIVFISLILCLVNSDQVPKKSTDQEWALLEKYKNFVNNNLMKNESNFYNSARKPKRTSEFLKRIKEPQNNDSIINHCGSREGKGKNI